MIKELMSDIIVMSFLAVINSFLLVYYIIPRISWVIVSRNLVDQPSQRSSHLKSTPTMAGVSFFLTMIMTLFFIQNFDTDKIGLSLVAAITIVFMVGLKDDLVVSTPKAKLIMETIAILFILFSSTMQVTTLSGFLGINEIPIAVSYPAIILLVLTIINAYNLIDGIDGLASVVAIVVFSIFGIIFFATGKYFYLLICLSFIGMLFAYLNYNLSHTKKIFMGDTGSLIIGFCIGFCSLKYIAMTNADFDLLTFKPENKLIVLVGVLFIPLFDMVRIIGVRLLNQKNPLTPDRNHIHHILVDSGLPHSKTALLLGIVNYIIAGLFIYLASQYNYFQMLGILMTLFTILLVIFDKLKEKNNVAISSVNS